ncbi:class I SAM-dependent methyltransferase [Sulfurimonas sp. CS5]|uniref:class I SAM-dependent methyltransferase n=1 Tax=Sulfurimonas sp. CS5 TaxID=3391145 RepID=UPI0039ECDF62
MKENEIRPQELFNELLRLNRLDIDKYFHNANTKSIFCPACESQGVHTFNKNEFGFDECPKCKTLYVSPRPYREYFDAYYTDSESTKFWATTFYKATEKNRREMLWKPKAQMILDKINTFSPNTQKIVDIGGGYGIFIEEFLKISSLRHLVVEPSEYLSQVCREKGLDVLMKFLEDIQINELSDATKTFVSFELFEHLHDPKEFLDTLHKLMNKNDVFIFTTLSGMGVDIRTLWDESKPVSPPMHLNFFNPKSIQILLESIGFETLEITTPGKLDIDIMNNSKENLKDRFWKDFLEYSSEEEKNNMQKYLSKNLLSSHMMIVCRKV